MVNKKRKLELLQSKHASLLPLFKCRSNSCGNPDHFSDYLCINAFADAAIGMGTTHVVCEYVNKQPVAICGFITLKAATLVKDNNYDCIVGDPAIEISELAVDEKYEKQGIGKDMLTFALKHCVSLHKKSIGIKYLVVCSDEKSVGFYEKGLKFRRAGDYYMIPREHWNKSCIPMYLKLENLYT